MKPRGQGGGSGEQGEAVEGGAAEASGAKPQRAAMSWSEAALGGGTTTRYI